MYHNLVRLTNNSAINDRRRCQPFVDKKNPLLAIRIPNVVNRSLNRSGEYFTTSRELLENVSQFSPFNKQFSD